MRSYAYNDVLSPFYDTGSVVCSCSREMWHSKVDIQVRGAVRRRGECCCHMSRQRMLHVKACVQHYDRFCLERDGEEARSWVTASSLSSLIPVDATTVQQEHVIVTSLAECRPLSSRCVPCHHQPFLSPSPSVILTQLAADVSYDNTPCGL